MLQLLTAETLVEALNTSAGVNQLLLAGIERVALGADFNTNILLGGTSLNYIAASALDGGRLIIGMNALFQVLLTSALIC